jgi:tRNA pseudouridine55 synthase
VISGVLLLDKPAGYSSNQALGRVKRLIGERKAGHTGTLDPFATGLLPICFGEATKFSADLLEADKGYRAVARLGERTSTGDTEGAILEKREVGVVTRGQVEAVLSQFRGVISQVPPMYSALKREGRPLYELARQGIEVERKSRSITVHVLELTGIEGASLEFEVVCSKGTYVRTLAEDIGAALGVGAHLTGLRRTLVGDLKLSDAVSLEALEGMSPDQRGNRLAPVDFLLRSLQRVELDAALSARFSQGQRLPMVLGDGEFAVYAAQGAATQTSPALPCRTGRLLGTARCESGVLRPQRLLAVEPVVLQSERN